MQMVIIVLLMAGLCLGSFVNALVWRLHEQEGQRAEGRRQSKKTKEHISGNLSILKGRSMCTYCRHTLAWYDLLPVVSWLSLRGKCRYCHKPISLQYPLVELATAGLFVFSYIFWPSALSPQPSALFAIWLVILVGFIALAIYDLHWMILPDRIVFPLQGLAVLYVSVLFVSSKGNWQVLFGALAGLLCSAGIFYLLFHISNGKWIGGGDVKLAVISGLILGGTMESLLMLFIASMFGSIIGIPLLVKGKAKGNSKLPFGPLLIIATVIVYLFGAGLIDWYKRQFLFI